MEPPAPRGARPAIRVVAAVIADAGRYLITQRRSSAVLPELWEFPGGRVEPGESDVVALAREVRHRLGVGVSVGSLISYVSHPYERYSVEFYLYDCLITEGEPEPRNVRAFRWVTSDEFERFPFTPADERSVAELLGVD